jgi:hypothetical protein
VPVYRIRVWNNKLQRQDEYMAEGLEAAKQKLEELTETKKRAGQTKAEQIRVSAAAARYLVAYKTRRDGKPRPKSSLAKERTFLNAYVLPEIGNAWIGDIDLPDLNALVRELTLKNGSAASSGTKSTVAAVIRRMWAWAREERIIPANPALELRTGWGGSVRRRIIIPSIPQVLRLAAALDHFNRASVMSPSSLPSLACGGKKLWLSCSTALTWKLSRSASSGRPASRAADAT